MRPQTKYCLVQGATSRSFTKTATGAWFGCGNPNSPTSSCHVWPAAVCDELQAASSTLLRRLCRRHKQMAIPRCIQVVVCIGRHRKRGVGNVLATAVSQCLEAQSKRISDTISLVDMCSAAGCASRSRSRCTALSVLSCGQGLFPGVFDVLVVSSCEKQSGNLL